ncbi:tyrosine-type recombinase/integrase [Oceanobacillus kimchii]|uniref:Tyrosine recombinase XerD n=1 Tax=Oceanobacillus kimchii TaxID=746691 RepID=A0ABQ5TGY2_9BACI|nr:tyrosine-type recombinase/integrase [Oceanobacillus kimchii]GLO66129.1 tyrosine recombinase XerD [Oceanobacillus kimchii]
MGRKYMRYVTQEKLDKLNIKNVKLVDKYFSFKNMNLSEDTKKSYMSDFNQWLVYIMENYNNEYILDILEEDVDDMVDLVEDFIAFCTTVLENKERRVQRRLSSISSFFLYLRRKRKIKENPIDFMERPSLKAGEKPQIVQTFLTIDQINSIRSELDKMNDIQLYTFYEVALSTMARIKAINNIKVSQINFKEDVIERVIEKEGYEVTLFPSEKAMELIRKLLKYREENGIECEYLFAGKRNGEWNKISKNTMQGSWTKKIGNLIDVPQLHAHDFRHSYSSILYNSGMKLEDVQGLLNHQSPDVTLKHYIKKDASKVKDNKKKFEV